MSKKLLARNLNTSSLLVNGKQPQGTLSMEEFKKPCNNRGYHIYQEVWAAAVGEELVCERETDNSYDR